MKEKTTFDFSTFGGNLFVTVVVVVLVQGGLDLLPLQYIHCQLFHRYTLGTNYTSEVNDMRWNQLTN